MDAGMKRSGQRGRGLIYHPLLTLPAGTELASRTETAMFYDRVLVAVISFLFCQLPNFESCILIQ